MKDQIEGYVRTLENLAHAALYHHYANEMEPTSYGEFLAYVRVISHFTGEHRSKVRSRIADEAKLNA